MEERESRVKDMDARVGKMMVSAGGVFALLGMAAKIEVVMAAGAPNALLSALIVGASVVVAVAAVASCWLVLFAFTRGMLAAVCTMVVGGCLLGGAVSASTALILNGAFLAWSGVGSWAWAESRTPNSGAGVSQSGTGNSLDLWMRRNLWLVVLACAVMLLGVSYFLGFFEQLVLLDDAHDLKSTRP